jgi:tRNA (adenine22-N1)-methyltransferase
VTEQEFSAKLQLNPRLLKIAQLVPKSKVLADIGTDHAYIPIWAVKNGIVDFAIASDINSGPVERARKNVNCFCLSEKIDMRLGPGLSTVNPDEAEVIVIAGMGGILISDILENGNEAAKKAKRLILQPMTAAKELRTYLCRNGYSIQEEHLVREDEKIYNILCVKFGDICQYSERELLLGRGVEATSPKLFDEYKSRILQKLEKREKGLEKSKNDDNVVELRETRRLIELIK